MTIDDQEPQLWLHVTLPGYGLIHRRLDVPGVVRLRILARFIHMLALREEGLNLELNVDTIPGDDAAVAMKSEEESHDRPDHIGPDSGSAGPEGLGYARPGPAHSQATARPGIQNQRTSKGTQ